MRLSIIIPIYNCEKEIGRLLDSILAQNWDKELYEVIACDDKSTDNCMENIKSYQDKMNIVCCKTKEREIHCPGNTRRDALPYAQGDWITFIDNDDMFEPNVFNMIWDKIQNDNIKYVLCCDIREWDAEKDIPLKEIHRTDTWLHGKFYNRQFLNDYNLTFKENLESHEDVYFNSLVLSALINLNSDFEYLDEYVYRWIYRPNSLSRIGFNQEYSYIEQHLNDYLIASSEPHIYGYLNYENKPFYYNQIMMTFLHGYFYYQASLWRLGSDDKIVRRNYNHMRNLLTEMFEINIMRDDIISYIYNLPDRYISIKNNCIVGSNNFIETQSLYDFVKNL